MKGLVDTINAGVETAFALAEEVVRLGVYTHKVGNGDYDPATDSMSETTQVFSDVRFMPSSVDVTDREASPIAVTDAKFIVPGKDLPIKPASDDFFELETGERWNVLIGKTPPGDSIHIIFARQA